MPTSAAYARPSDEQRTFSAASVQDSTVDAARRQRVIDTLVARMERLYVFPGQVPALASSLRQRIRRGDYDALTNAVAFADTLTKHVREVIPDRHLSVRFLSPRRPATPALPLVTIPRPPRGPDGEGEAWVDSVRILPSNIGYLALSGFADKGDAAAPFAKAMTKLADTDALIIDIRGNGGGDPTGVALLISYLVGTDSIHTNSFHFRDGDSTMHFWTSPNVAGRKFGPSKPVYVLTDNRTFSAAEEFAYNLQALKRATLIGETTRGGANPGQVTRLDAEFAAFIPFAQARNPITGTNWEGTGVKPEIAVRAADALDRAIAEVRKQKRR